MPDIVITVLVENSVNIGGLRAEHGLALLIRTGTGKLLFDTGQSDLLAHNARQMGLNLEDLDAIVLSHGHYDHTGGLEAACRMAVRARLALHPAAIEPKFTVNADGSSRSIGIRKNCLESVQKADHRVTWATRPTEVAEGIFLTGPIPRRNSFEDTGGRFFLDEACTQPDPLVDDQALYFDTANGVVIVLGCAHSGVVNTVEYVRELTHGRPIRAVLGGMHLQTASPERIERTISAFRRRQVTKLAPAHCTGVSALARLWAAFPDCCSSFPVGTSVVFPR